MPFGKGFVYKPPAHPQGRVILDVKICASAMRHGNRLLSDAVDSLSLEHLEKRLSGMTAAGRGALAACRPGFLMASRIPLCFQSTSKHMYKLGIHAKCK